MRKIGRYLAGGIAAVGLLAAPAAAQAATPAATPVPVQHVVVVGIPGLQWSDVSARQTPALYRIAGQGSVGSLVEYALKGLTCPADGWLTLNAGVRAGVAHPEKGPCPAQPGVQGQTVAGMPQIVSYNASLGYQPAWGTLAGAASCSLAAGPGAALALAGADGKAGSYMPDPAAVTGADLARCPLSVIDLGALPGGAGGARTAAVRGAAVRAADASLGRLAAELPPGTTLLVTSPGAVDKAHLGVVVADGPGYRDGLLHASSTRQPGLVVLTDLTSTVRHWLGAAASATGGAVLSSGSRGSLDAAISSFTARQTAERVWTTSHSWFFWTYALADAALLAGIGLLFWGAAGQRRRQRARWWRITGVFAAAMPAGTFLAGLVPWARWSHPAAWLYGVSVVIGVLLAGVALAAARHSRLRDDPLAPFGLVCLVTVLILGVDVMTGSRLQLETPFGLSVLEAGRFYGIGNEALGIYGIAALVAAAWLALRFQTQRRQALLAVAVVAVFTVFASGWPGFGGKAGGTITLVPCFLVLAGAVAGWRFTWRRALLIAVSGLLLFAVFALINYLVPATGSSDIGKFAGDVLHGRSAGNDLLMRKFRSNIGSLSVNAFSPLIPVVLLLTGLMLWRPSWFRLRLLPRAYQAIPLLLPILGDMWLLALLGWFANDSGIIVPASALPFALPLGIGLAAGAVRDAPSAKRGARVGDAAGAIGDAAGAIGDAAGAVGAPREGSAVKRPPARELM